MSKNSTRLLTVLSAALLTCAGAQTATSATLLQPGEPNLTMPLDVNLLPAGTVTITPGTYYIPDFEQTGISIYLQSPHPLTVGTAEQMLGARTKWERLMAALSKVDSVTSTAAKTAAFGPVLPVPAALPTPTPQSVFKSPAAPAVPAPRTAAKGSSATGSAASAPTAPVPAPAFPAAQNVFAAPAAPSAFPGSKNVFTAPATAAATGAFPGSKSVFEDTAAASAPAPAAPPTPVTLMPSYVDMKWRGRGGVATAYITNLNPTRHLKINPASLRIYQNGAPLQAQLSVRDSSGATQPSELLPRSMFTVLVRVTPSGTAPLTLTWEARDDAGTVYPIRYSWLPQ